MAGDPSGEGGVSRPGGQGSKIYVLSSKPKEHNQDDGQGGLGLRGVAFMTVFGGFDCFGGSGEHLALCLLVLQNTVPRDDRDGFDGFGGFGGCGGFGRDGYPP